MSDSNALVLIQNEVMSQRMSDQLRMVLPPYIPIEKFQRVTITAINKNPQLVEADRLSLLNACVECATDGLLPNGKEAALVIYNTKDRQTNLWKKMVRYMPMVAGIYKLAHNSGEFKVFRSELVHKNDVFEYELGFDVTLTHKPALADPGDVTHAYSVVIMQDGTRDIEVMRLNEIKDVQGASKAENGPWDGPFWGEMARKTVIRRHAKRLPLSTDLERVIQNVDQLYDVNQEPRVVNPPEQIPPRPTSTDLPADFVLFTHENVIERSGLGPAKYTELMLGAVKDYGEHGAEKFQAFLDANEPHWNRLLELNQTDMHDAILNDVKIVWKNIEAKFPAAEASSASPPPPEQPNPSQVDQQDVPAGGELSERLQDIAADIAHGTFHEVRPHKIKWFPMGKKTAVEFTDPVEWCERVLKQVNHHLTKIDNIKSMYLNQDNTLALNEMLVLGGVYAEQAERVKAAIEEKIK